MMQAYLRKPVVAGQFYPAQALDLRKAISVKVKAKAYDKEVEPTV